MPLFSLPDRHGLIPRLLHWITAAALVPTAILGLLAHAGAEALARDGGATAPRVAALAQTFSLHKTFGIALLALTVLRLYLASGHPRPGLLHGHRRAEAMAAATIHRLLLLTLILVPLSGWAAHAASGPFAPILWPFGQSLPGIAPDPGLSAAFRGAHKALLLLMAGALTLHVVASVLHAVRDRDGSLARITRGTPAAASGPQPSGPRAWTAAVALVAAAILVAPPAADREGAAWRMPDNMLSTTPEAEHWQVIDGTLSLTVQQFGREIRGSFTSWSADIVWDESGPLGPAGHVTVEVDVASLDLGAVTAQATGPDFLAPDRFPRAVFEATLLRRIDGQRAEGTLTLRGMSRPVAFPFRLSIENGTAWAGGSLVLDRRDFGIGANLPEGDKLAFPVEVVFDLRAERVR